MTIKTINLSFYITFILSISIFCFVAYLMSDNRIDEEYTQVVLIESQSIWEIAEEYSSHHSLTPSEFVEWVEKNNKIDANIVLAGSSITIPIKKELADEMILLVADGGIGK